MEEWRRVMERTSGRAIRKIGYLLPMLVMVFTLIRPMAMVSAAGGQSHYLAFASDRHSNTGAIEASMGNFSSATEYVCLIGDMVNNQDAYYSSEVYAEVMSLFPNAAAQIVWGTHDIYMTDDANICYGRTIGSSDLIYAGYNSDGSIAYYVYGVAYYDVSNKSYAQTAADKFESWISNVSDKTIPIFVAGHMPLHASRNDNNGGYTWAKALNYAATGSETGTVITRNVVYLHGHNHTNEHAEYYYAPGSSVKMEDNDAGDPAVTIGFTYLTAGYLNEFSHATQVTMTEDRITFVRTNGSLGYVERVEADESGEEGPGEQETEETTHSHLFVQAASQAATCTVDGWKEYYQCTSCGKYYEDQTGKTEIGNDADLAAWKKTAGKGKISATGHQNTEIRNVVEAQAGVEGYTGDTYCKDCGTLLKTGSKTDALPVEHVHSYSEEVTTKAGCSSAGVKTYTCAGCGDTYTANIPATGHQNTEIRNAVEAQAGVEGYTGDTYCKDCGTLLKTGSKTDALPVEHVHSYSGVVTTKTGCSSAGVKTYTCAGCGDTYTETVPATDHVWDSGKVTTEATALKKGVRTYTCTVCKKTSTKAIAKLKATIRLSTVTVPLQVKKSVKLTSLVTGLAKDDSITSWKSSDTKIATVKAGKVTAAGKTGTVKITVKTKAGASAKFTIKVQKGIVKTKSIQVNKTSVSLEVKKTFTIKTTLKPLSSTQKVTYKTSSKKVAAVSSKGVITAKKKGKATITVKSGSKSVKIKVTVK